MRVLFETLFRGYCSARCLSSVETWAATSGCSLSLVNSPAALDRFHIFPREIRNWAFPVCVSLGFITIAVDFAGHNEQSKIENRLLFTFFVSDDTN